MMLPWLERPLENLLAVHRSGRLAHALLIRAHDGWGAVNLANAFAAALIERPGADASALAHPDLKWIRPEGSVIKVDDIRELAAFANGTRSSAPVKVAVIESAELLNVSASNALLKTLEEPPGATHLLLTSSRPGRLLPTIVSRCQSVTVPRDVDRAKDWLATRWPAAGVERKVFECGEAPLAVAAGLEAGEGDLAAALVALARRTPASAEVGALLEWDVERLTSGWYRHCVALLAGRSRLGSLKAPDARRLCGFVDELTSTRHQLLSTNSANQRLLYERLAVRWRSLFA